MKLMMQKLDYIEVAECSLKKILLHLHFKVFAILPYPDSLKIRFLTVLCNSGFLSLFNFNMINEFFHDNS